MRKVRLFAGVLVVLGLILGVQVFSALAEVPVIDSITPNSGPNTSTTNVTITGSNFEQGAKVFLFPGGPYIIGSFDTLYAQGVYVSGNYAYVADYRGLLVIDISDPSSPVIIGSVYTPGSATDVYVSGNYAYVADRYYYAKDFGSFQVIDISDPSSPVIIGSVDTPGIAEGVYVSGSYAYVADSYGGLQVIDISIPSSPAIIGSVDTPSRAFGVYVSGNYAYVADGYYGGDIGGLQVIDISDPSSPVIIGSVDTPRRASDVYVSGSYAYVAVHYRGLQVIDISIPSSPAIIGSVDTPGRAFGVYVSGNYAYMADGADGLQVIDISIPLDSNVGNSSTITATVPANLPEGAYDIVVSNPVSGEVGTLPNGFRVVDGVVDNSDYDFSVQGTWRINRGKVVPDVYGKSFHHSAPGDGSDTATWDAELVKGAGNYEVFVWYPIYPGLAANAPFTINHAGISDTLIVDQGINGGQWVSLGIYEFLNNGTENITLSDKADSWVAADAVAFAIPGNPPPPQPPDGTVDNADPRFSVTGIWDTALRTVLPGVYGADFRYHAAGDGTEKATWLPELTDGPGYYEVSIRYPVYPLLAANAAYTINHNGESETILIDQSRNGGKCLNLGIYYFADDGTENITLSDNADSWVAADVVSFTPTSPPLLDGIVDNLDPKFTLTGTWLISKTNKAPDFFGTDFRYHAPGDGTETAIWDTELINGPGFYEVSVWYPKNTLLAANAAYTINHNNISDTVLINQGVNGGQWVSLGSYEFADDGTERIILSDKADSWVVADAVRFELPIINVNITNPKDNFVIGVGETISVKAAITGRYGGIITDAVVTASFSNGDPDITLYDDGAHGDKESNDGIYANEWLPQNLGQYTITVNAGKPGYFDETSTLDGGIFLIPQIDSVDPSSGSANLDTDMIISGYNFATDTKVFLREGGSYITGFVYTPGDAYGVYVSGSYAYVADDNSGLQVIDISDPASPYIVGSVDTPGDAHNVYISGSYAYVADVNSSLQVIDISDPASPYIVGSVNIPDYANDLYISGSYAYVADGFSGLQVIDISDPASPYIVGSVNTPDYTNDLYISGSYAYVADGFSGLQVIDISTPSSPEIIGSVDTPGFARGVYVSGNYAYVADWNSGLQVIDISIPSSPSIIGSVDTPDIAFGVYVSGSYAYVADGFSGLQVIDINIPSSPAIIGSVDTPGYVRGVYVSGNYAYVPDGSSGLQIIMTPIELDINVVDSTTITAIVPANLPPGVYDITVVNPGVGRDILDNGFEIF